MGILILIGAYLVLLLLVYAVAYSLATDAARPLAIKCPHCERRSVETARVIRVVRGRIVGTAWGSYLSMGCVPCVASEVRIETTRNACLGWWSIGGLLLTPVVLISNVANLVERPNENELARTLAMVGIKIGDLAAGEDGLAGEERRLLRMVAAAIGAVAGADGTTVAERDAAISALRALSDQQLDRGQAEAMLDQSMTDDPDYSELDAEQRYVVMAIAVEIALSDGLLTDPEHDELLELSDLLDLPSEFLEQLLRTQTYDSGSGDDPRGRAARLLGVDPTASVGEIRTAFKKLALLHHPDRVPLDERDEAHIRMVEINDAYDLLLSGGRRHNMRS